jgi:hypothetical protein
MTNSNSVMPAEAGICFWIIHRDSRLRGNDKKEYGSDRKGRGHDGGFGNEGMQIYVMPHSYCRHAYQHTFIPANICHAPRPSCLRRQASRQQINITKNYKILSYKSNQFGLSLAINLFFHSRFHFFKVFSLVIAFIIF